MDFKAHLVRQLRFIGNSAKAFDEGDPDEAIRIGTSTRVLMHDTNRSTSLLTHLQKKNINLLTTCRTDLSFNGVLQYLGMGSIGRHVSGKEVRVQYMPGLGDGPTNRIVPLDEWWNQIVFVKDFKPIARKHIVLGAANQDGGAHVDPALKAEYEALTEFAAPAQVGPRLDFFEVARDAHLVSLRQVAYELLNSPELTALAT